MSLKIPDRGAITPLSNPLVAGLKHSNFYPFVALHHVASLKAKKCFNERALWKGEEGCSGPQRTSNSRAPDLLSRHKDHFFRSPCAAAYNENGRDHRQKTKDDNQRDDAAVTTAALRLFHVRYDCAVICETKAVLERHRTKKKPRQLQNVPGKVRKRLSLQKKSCEKKTLNKAFVSRR